MDGSNVQVKQKHIWPQASDFIENMDVLVNYKNKGRWYRGKIEAVQLNGRFDIRYDDDNTVEENVEASQIRPIFVPGQSVEANVEGKSKCFVILKQARCPILSYWLSSEDVPKILVPVDQIRCLFSNHEIVKGSLIDGNWRGEGNWYPGTVTRVRPNGTFDIAYDDGDEELAVEHQNIKVRSARQVHTSPTTLGKKSGRELCRVAAVLELSGHMTEQNEDGISISNSQKRHVSI
jgi:hypothetical protein